MIVIEVPAFAFAVITLAAALYIAKRIEEVVRAINRSVLQRRINEINALHDEALAEIRTDFEFLWTTEFSQKVRDALVAESPFPSEFLTVEEEQYRERVIAQGLQNTHGVALHLAVHARMGDREKKLMARLPRGQARDQIRESYEEHEVSLEADRHVFMQIGFDVQEFERFFSSAS